MYQENKDDLKQWLLSNITDLLVNEDTKPEERKILLDAKHELENGESANYVCNLIRVGLDPLSWQGKLSHDVMKFHYACGGAALGMAFSGLMGK